MITAGFPSFLNTRPILYGLERNPEWRTRLRVITDLPSHLGVMMRDGRIDLGLIPAGMLTREYPLVPGVSITGPDSMKSVILCSNREMTDTTPWKVRLAEESFTSNMLTMILCREKYRNGAEFVTDGETDARVLIGDTALRELNGGERKWRFIIDLAKEWYEWTGLPMVFAVLAARRITPQIVEAAQYILQARDFGIDHLDDVAENSICDFMTREEVKAYLKSIDYSLTEKHILSMERFLASVRKLGYRDREFSGRWLW